MKKSIQKILMLLFIIVMVFAWLGINFSFAAEATISVPSVTVGQDFTVTVNIPAEAVAYEGKVSITFSDGTTQTSGKLTKVTGIDGDYAFPGNMTHTFNAAKEGQATIKVTGLVISSKDHKQLNENETLEKTITIAAKEVPPANTTPSNPSTPTTPSEPETPPSNPSTPETPPASNEPTWRETGDTVYALEDLNVRNGWGTSYNKIGTLSKNSSTKRIAVGSNGWDKIEYGNKIAYVKSEYLTTEKPEEDKEFEEEKTEEPTWRETGDTVYALGDLNVREGWGKEYKVIGSLTKNSSTKRIAVGSNGWDKIEFGNKIAYVKSEYLTTEEPEEDELENEVKNESIENTNVVNDTMDQGDIYNTIIEEVGVIPPVGKNIVDYIYIFAVVLSIGMVAFIGIKIRENNKE